MARGSQNYVTTVHTECAGDMLELETIRKAVKVINKDARQQDYWNKTYQTVPTIHYRGIHFIHHSCEHV